MNKLCKIMLCVFVAGISFLIVPSVVHAEEIMINLEEELNGDCEINDIQNALDQSRDDESNYYTIIVPKGVYELHDTQRLRIYSNTTLDLTGVTIKRTSDSKVGAMIMVANPRLETGKSTSKGGGYTKGGYTRGHDMKIIGGTFDSGTWYGDNYSTLCTFSHVKNMTFDGTTFIYKPKKSDDAHMIEFGASKDITIKNCKFIGNQKVGEAIQIESAVKGVSGSDLMGKEDGTATKNVSIVKCVFNNFQYAIGTNHGCKKDKYTGFSIKNNSFEKIGKYVLCVYNYRNTVIKGNIVKSSGKKSFDSLILNLGQKSTLKKSNNKVK